MKPLLSGKFVLRIPPQLHDEFKQEALLAGISLNQLILGKLNQPSTNKNLPQIIQQVFQKSLLGVVLFGSVARGEQRVSSDIDLLLVMKESTSIDRQLYRQWDSLISPVIGEAFTPQFSLLPKDLLSVGSLWLEVALEGQILHDTNDIVRRQLSLIRGKIAEGYYIRRASHGNPYWARGSLMETKPSAK